MSGLNALKACLPCSFFKAPIQQTQPSVQAPSNSKKTSAILEPLQKRVQQMQQYFVEQKNLGMKSPLARKTFGCLAVGSLGLAGYYFIPGASDFLSKLFSQALKSDNGTSPIPKQEEVSSAACEGVFSKRFEGQSSWADAPNLVSTSSRSLNNFSFPSAANASTEEPTARFFQDKQVLPLTFSYANASSSSSFFPICTLSDKPQEKTIANGSHQPPLPKDKKTSSAGSVWLKLAPFALLLPAVVFSPVNEKDEVPRPKLWEKTIKILPYVGLGMGLLWGLSGRMDLSSKSSAACKAGFTENPFFETVNRMKQWELKNIAYLTPLLIPSSLGVVSKFFKKEAGVDLGGFSLLMNKKVSTAALAAFGLIFAHPVVTRFVSSPIPGFKLSGHFLLKTVCAGLVSNAGEALSQKTTDFASKKMVAVGQMALVTAGAAYAASDAIFLANTATHCHTVAEAILGLAAGASLIKLSQSFGNRIEKNLKGIWFG